MLILPEPEEERTVAKRRSSTAMTAPVLKSRGSPLRVAKRNSILLGSTKTAHRKMKSESLLQPVLSARRGEMKKKTKVKQRAKTARNMDL